MKRTFIALPVEASDNLRKLFSLWQSELNGEQIKWTEPDKLHITLKFLGDTPEDQVNLISEKLSEVFGECPVMEGHLVGLDYFSYQGSPSVLLSRFISLSDPGRMVSLLGSFLGQFGFRDESRPFNAHLTLARIKFLRDPGRFRALVASSGDMEIQPVRLVKVVFYESILQPRGPIYKPLKVIPLLG